MAAKAETTQAQREARVARARDIATREPGKFEDALRGYNGGVLEDLDRARTIPQAAVALIETVPTVATGPARLLTAAVRWGRELNARHTLKTLGEPVEETTATRAQRLDRVASPEAATRNIDLPIVVSVDPRRSLEGVDFPVPRRLRRDDAVYNTQLNLVTSDGRTATVVRDDVARVPAVDHPDFTAVAHREPTGITLTQTAVGENHYVVDIQLAGNGQKARQERLLVEATSGDAALGNALIYLVDDQTRHRDAYTRGNFDDRTLLDQDPNILTRAGIDVRYAQLRGIDKKQIKITPIAVKGEHPIDATGDPRLLIPSVRHAVSFGEAASARVLTGDEVATLDREGSAYREAVMAGVRARIFEIFLDPSAQIVRARTEVPRTSDHVAYIPGTERDRNGVVAIITTRDETGELVGYRLQGNDGGFYRNPTMIEVTTYTGKEPHVYTRALPGDQQIGISSLGNDTAKHDQDTMKKLGVTPREVATVASSVA